MTRRLWRVEVVVVPEDAEAVEDALENGLGDMVQATARMQRGDAWLLQALCRRRPTAAAVRAALRDWDIARTHFEIAPLPDADWVAEGLKHLPPVRSGRFLVVGTHHPPPSATGHALLIDAGPAFGTGQHATTRGCLLALDRLGRTWRPRRVLDLGCGTGILAMAAARIWRGRPPDVVAGDVDPPSIVEAGRNLARNGLRRAVRLAAADGLNHPWLRAAAPYDLILANILALPLIRLAPLLRRHLAPGGVVVLSGLLDEQAPAVRNAYRAAGLVLLACLRLPGWPTLVMRRA